MSDQLIEIEALAKRFFDSIEAGDVSAVADCYAEDVAIWHDADQKTQGKAENLRVLNGLVSGTTERQYVARRLTTFPGGFVQQHILDSRTKCNAA